MGLDPPTGRRGGFCCDADLAKIGCDGRDWEPQLAELREQGPRAETAELLEVVLREGVTGATVIDVGAGVGALHLAMLEAGAFRAVDVDASRSTSQPHGRRPTDAASRTASNICTGTSSSSPIACRGLRWSWPTPWCVATRSWTGSSGRSRPQAPGWWA